MRELIQGPLDEDTNTSSGTAAEGGGDSDIFLKRVRLYMWI